MNKQDKKNIIELLNIIFNENITESKHIEVNDKLNKILIDPKWSDYIFWSDDYILPNGNIDYDKFFKKIEHNLLTILLYHVTITDVNEKYETK